MRNALGIAAIIVVSAAILLALAVAFTGGLLVVTGWLHLQHVLGIDTQQSKNYDFVSGVGPMIVASLGFSSLGVAAWHHLNCEHPGCPRLGHRHPDHGRPVCRIHYRSDAASTL